MVMLCNQAWINYANDLPADFRQALEEGKDVGALEAKCSEIRNMSPNDPQRNILADEMYQKLIAAPVKEDYCYNEPSDLETIKSTRPKNRPVSNNNFDKTALYEKVYGAWLGRVAGCLLGKPVECWHRSRLHALLTATNNYPLQRYMSSDIPQKLKDELIIQENRMWVNEINGKAPVDDDTNYTVLGLKILEHYGHDFTNHDVAEAWLSHMPYLSACTAERVAYRNISSGIFPPQSATYKNPYRDWIGAQIRADFFGYINPGNPELAAEMAWRDASISHIKNGIYGEMFVAAMLAAAAVTDDILKIIEIGLGEIPENSRLTEKINLLISWYNAGISADDVVNRIHEIYNEKDFHHWCHTISNAMIVVFGLLYGAKDFEKSICIAVQAAFDTDCNGATVGSIIGMIIGANAIPEKWTSPFNDILSTTIQGYEVVKLSDIARKTIEYIK